MNSRFIIFTAFLFFVTPLHSCKIEKKSSNQQPVRTSDGKQEWAIVIHGGAGDIARDKMTPEMDAEYRKGLNEALVTGKKILSEGGSALDAVEKTIRVMEDNPLFNAGKGAVFTHDGKNELDAAIMDGSTLAGVSCLYNRYKKSHSAARKVCR